ncbi:MAG: phosphotransferase [Ilumatobacteraceae bacterium]
MDPSGITSAWLSSVLGGDVELVGSTRIGDGLVGMNLRLELRAAAGLPDRLIAKLPSPDPTSRATGAALRNYEREVKFYRDIAPTVDIRVARCFHGEWDPTDHDFVLLLEDLAPAQQGDQVAGCSVEHARVAVLELARLHGPRWGDTTLDDIEFLERRSGEAAAQLQTIYGMFMPGFLATYSRYLDRDAVDLIEQFASRVAEWVDGRDLPRTVTHGDYRLDNLMFESASGGYPVAAVDWQTPGHGQATADVSYFLGAGPLTEDRRRVERELVDEYLDALSRYDVTVDADHFWHHYARDAFGGVIMSVVASQIVGSNERSEAMFAAMAVRHTRHALDLDARSLV